MSTVVRLSVFLISFFAITAFSAPDALTGLALWLDADDAATISTNASGSVTNWLDKSGLSRNADYFEGTPDVVTNALNGRAVINFDGSAYLGTTFNFDALSEHTLLTVARYTSGARGRVISSRTQNWLFGFHGNRDERWHPNGWVSQSGTANDHWHMHVGTIDSAPDPSADFYKDGVLITRNSLGSNGSTYKPGQLGLGAYRSATSEPSDCEIAEVIIYDRVLSTEELNEVGFYLQEKYGFDHGYSDAAGPFVVIDNFDDVQLASNVTTISADVQGNLLSTGTAAVAVSTLFGTSNGGFDPLAWDQQQMVAGVTTTGTFSDGLSGLAAGTVYWFRFMAVSGGDTNFSEVGSFHTELSSFPFAVVPNGLKLWLDASGQTYADGDAAPVWIEQTTNEWSGFQVGAGEIPTFVTNGINGQPAFHFDQTDMLLIDDFSAVFGGNEASVFVVARSDIAANYNLITTRRNAPEWRVGTFSRMGTFRPDGLM